MIETLTHLDAFEKYFAIGDKRSYTELARILPYSRTSIKNWGKAHNWKERVQLRDIDNAKEIAKRTDRTVVATKANYRKDIEDSLKIIKDTILSAVNPATRKLNISTKTPADINALSAAYERLCKLDLILVGENAENETVTIKIDIDNE